jgi:hypothetical protein
MHNHRKELLDQVMKMETFDCKSYRELRYPITDLMHRYYWYRYSINTFNMKDFETFRMTKELVAELFSDGVIESIQDLASSIIDVSQEVIDENFDRPMPCTRVVHPKMIGINDLHYRAPFYIRLMGDYYFQDFSCFDSNSVTARRKILHNLYGQGSHDPARVHYSWLTALDVVPAGGAVMPPQGPSIRHVKPGWIDTETDIFYAKNLSVEEVHYND